MMLKLMLNLKLQLKIKMGNGKREMGNENQKLVKA